MISLWGQSDARGQSEHSGLYHWVSSDNWRVRSSLIEGAERVLWPQPLPQQAQVLASRLLTVQEQTRLVDDGVWVEALAPHVHRGQIRDRGHFLDPAIDLLGVHMLLTLEKVNHLSHVHVVALDPNDL